MVDASDVHERSPEEVVEHLRSMATAIQSQCVTLAKSLPRTNRNVVLVKLLMQLGLQMDRLCEWSTVNFADPLAWVARNIFELNLLTRWILESDTNLWHFIGQRVKDEIDILEGVLEFREDQPDAVVAAEGERHLRERIEHLNRVSSRWGVKPERDLVMKALAKKFGLQREYNGLYKLFSKYVHPSSWLVNGETADIHALEYRNLFLMEAQRYPSDMFIRIWQEMGAGERAVQ